MRVSALVSTLLAAQLAVAAVIDRRQDAPLNDEEDSQSLSSSPTVAEDGPTPTDSNVTAGITDAPEPTGEPEVNEDGSFGGEVDTIRKGQFGGEEGTISAPNLGPTRTTAVPKAIATEGSDLIISCHRQFYEVLNGDTPFMPFCEPRNGDIWRPNTSGKYYVTWDVDHFNDHNETVQISLNRPTKDLYRGAGDPQVVWESDPIPVGKGFMFIQPKDDLLYFNGSQHAEAELYLIIASNGVNPKSGGGPTIKLTTLYDEDRKPVGTGSSPVDKKAIAIGIPVAFVGAALLLLLLHCTMRRERRLGPIHIGGRRGRGDYASRKSQAERMRGAAPHQRLPSRAESTDWELSNVNKEANMGNEPMSPFRDTFSPISEQPAPARFRDSR